MDEATLGSGQPPPSPPPHSSLTSLPVLAITILGMLTTAVLLVSYYLFVIQCRPSWRHSDHRLLRRLFPPPHPRLPRRLFPSAHSSRHLHIPSILHALAAEFHGLDPSVIRSIPVVKFSTIGTPFHDCAICLNEFQDGESLKQLPICSHAFHIDCIDTWLEFNSNCPLCRSDIRSPSAASATDHIVVLAPRREQRDEDEAPAADPSPRRKGKKYHSSGSMGDECIDSRGKCEQMWVQPVRRSFSMDSCNDRQFYLSIQEILRQRQGSGEGSTSNGVSRGEGGGGSARARRSLFSFGWSSRSSVIPIEDAFDV